MTILEFSTEINATQKELFDFHTNFKNVAIVTPPVFKVRFVTIPDSMAEGSEMTIEIKQFGLWMPWDVKVEKLIQNSLMVDYQSGRGPFKYWKHEHQFTERNNKTILKDRIEYQLPFGILGLLIDVIVMRFVQKMVFAYRHKKTKEYFSAR
jgi:ligand-binding SRPBCC domain-containing protein